MTDSKTNHESFEDVIVAWLLHPLRSETMTAPNMEKARVWKKVGQSEGGARTVPFYVLPTKPTGRRWRVTYEEYYEVDE